MTSVIRKFDFGRSFDKPDLPTAAAAVAVPEIPPEPVYGQADLDAAEARGFMSGQLEGARLAAERQEHRIALAVTDIAAAFPSLGAQLRDRLGDIERQAAALVLRAAECLFPKLIADTGREELGALIGTAFEHAVEEPRVTIRCAAAMLTDLDGLIRSAAAQAGYGGKLTIIGDPLLSEAACRAEWSDGGLERDPVGLLAAIEAALRHGLDRAESGTPDRAGP